MTVCTASSFFWFGNELGEDGKPVPRPAVLVAADRMLTDTGLGIEYESSRWKGMELGPRHMVMIAGDLSFHSDALGVLKAALPQDGSVSGHEIAHKLSEIMIRIRHMRAAQTYLGPLGLTPESFLAQQTTMSPEVALSLTANMQNYLLDAEAMVVGHDGAGSGICLLRIDERGIVTNHIDTGFLSIGAGGIHSSAYFMQLPYSHAVGYHPALWNIFLAKKRAEVAPGVGNVTDIFRLTADGLIKVPDAIIEVMERLHRRQKTANQKSSEQWVARLVKGEAVAIETLRKQAEKDPSNK